MAIGMDATTGVSEAAYTSARTILQDPIPVEHHACEFEELFRVLDSKLAYLEEKSGTPLSLGKDLQDLKRNGQGKTA
eukprot:10594335-Prorocentrum_lima.AAC.1